jgi:RNA polymerase sigma factor (sigma-70 family)
MEMAAIPLMCEFAAEPESIRGLVRAAKAGDVASFEQLIALHERPVLRLAQRLLLNRELAQDAAQEVFLRLHSKLGKFDDGKDLGPWLYRITVNICHDLRRRSKPDLPLDLAPPPSDEGRTRNNRPCSPSGACGSPPRSGSWRSANARRSCYAISKGFPPARWREFWDLKRLPFDHKSRSARKDQAVCDRASWEQNMKHHMNEVRLALYLRADLSGSDQRDVARHVETCAECQNTLADLSRSYELLTGSLGEPTPAELRALRTAVAARIQARGRGPLWRRWAFAASAAVATIILLSNPRQENRIPHPPVPPPPQTSLARIAPTVSMARKTEIPREPCKRTVPAARTMTLLTRADRPAWLKISTSDPNVVILWQLNENGKVETP